MKGIILIGAGGHANSCLDVILNSKKYKVLYFVDKKKRRLEKYKVIIERKFISNNLNKKMLHVAVGQLKTGKKREEIFNLYKNKGCIFPVILSKNSFISNNVKIDEGTIVMHKAIINRNVKIGKNCIINSGSIIEHDTVIEDNVHVAPGAIVLGGCQIKRNSFIGSAAVIKQDSLIKQSTIIPSMKYFKS